MIAASRENQISYESYCYHGGCRNSALTAVVRSNGSHVYVTYHHVGYGRLIWRQDKPAGPIIGRS